MKPTTSDEVFELMESFATSAALNAALETGLFWMLVEGPLDASEIARAQNVPPHRCEYWLQLLVSIGLLEHRRKGYVPSATARTVIIESYSQDTWAFLAGEMRDRFPAVLDLARQIQEPGSV
jgi:hypothetical protein